MDILPFILHPNFQILTKYLPFDESLEELQEMYKDGFEIEANRYYTPETIRHIEDSFCAIVKKYDIEVHYDNLLLMALDKLEVILSSLFELKRLNEYKLRGKEVAQLLLTFKETEPKDYHSIQFKTRLGTAKVTDERVIELVLNLLSDGIRDRNYGIGSFEWTLSEQLFDETPKGKQLSIPKLEVQTKQTIVSHKRKEKVLLADFCLYMFKYLESETDMRPDSTKLLPDRMLHFYYDVLVLFELINPKSIDSEPKDYVSSLLRNRLAIINN